MLHSFSADEYWVSIQICFPTCWALVFPAFSFLKTAKQLLLFACFQLLVPEMPWMRVFQQCQLQRITFTGEDPLQLVTSIPVVASVSTQSLLRMVGSTWHAGGCWGRPWRRRRPLAPSPCPEPFFPPLSESSHKAGTMASPWVGVSGFGHSVLSHRWVQQDVLSSVPWFGYLGLYRNRLCEAPTWQPLSETWQLKELLAVKVKPSLLLTLLFLSISHCLCFCPSPSPSLWRIMGWNSNKCRKLQVFQVEEFLFSC